MDLPKGNDWQAGLGHFHASAALAYYLYVQMGHPAVVEVLKSFHDVPDVESDFLFHQLIVIHKVV